jgi:hypothetical protein
VVLGVKVSDDALPVGMAAGDIDAVATLGGTSFTAELARGRSAE